MITKAPKGQPQEPMKAGTDQKREYMQYLQRTDPGTYRIFSNLQRIIDSHNKHPHHIEVEQPADIVKLHFMINREDRAGTAKQIRTAIEHYNQHSYDRMKIVFIKTGNNIMLGRVILKAHTHEILEHSPLLLDELREALTISAVWKEATAERDKENRAAWKLSGKQSQQATAGTAPLWICIIAFTMQPKDIPNMNIYDIDTGKEVNRRRSPATKRNNV